MLHLSSMSSWRDQCDGLDWSWLLVLTTLAPVRAFAGPAEDVAAAIDRWVTTFNANDVGALVKLYTPDAVLVGAAGSTLNEGSEAIRKYFARLEKSGDKVSIGIRKVFCAWRQCRLRHRVQRIYRRSRRRNQDISERLHHDPGQTRQ